MGKYKGVFKRREKKYIIDLNQMEQLLQKINQHIIPDEYGKSVICNIYLDTPNFQLIRKSIEKPLYKEKMRIRCYGVLDDESNTFVELKKKFEGVVYKRRVTPCKDEI